MFVDQAPMNLRMRPQRRLRDKNIKPYALLFAGLFQKFGRVETLRLHRYDLFLAFTGRVP